MHSPGYCAFFRTWGSRSTLYSSVPSSRPLHVWTFWWFSPSWPCVGFEWQLPCSWWPSSTCSLRCRASPWSYMGGKTCHCCQLPTLTLNWSCWRSCSLAYMDLIKCEHYPCWLRIYCSGMILFLRWSRYCRDHCKYPWPASPRWSCLRFYKIDN